MNPLEHDPHAVARPKVALAYPLTDSGAQRELEQDAQVIVSKSGSPEDLKVAVREAEGLIVRGPAKITDEILEAGPKMRVVASSGSGADSVDIEAATARGVLVTSNAGVAPMAVSEFVLAAAIVARRRLVGESERMFNGDYAQWDLRTRDVTTREVIGSTFGIVGFGHIGRDVARRAKAGFDAQVIAFDPYCQDKTDDVEWADSLSELCERSDVVSVHVPLVGATRGLIGRRELEAIGSEGVFINAARGGIVDFADLIACLNEGKLGGAAIDVYDTEPPSPETIDLLRSTPRLFCTPHVAGVNGDAMRRLASSAAKTVLLALSGQLPPNALNPDVWKR